MHLLYIGRLVQRQKRFYDAIELFKKLPGDQKLFDVVGAPKPTFLTGAHIDRKICFHGFLNTWDQLVNDRTVLIIPSDYEGFPLVFLEFIKAGGKFMVCREADWCSSRKFESHRYDTLQSAISKLKDMNSIKINHAAFNDYFSQERLERELRKLESWI